jgi:hypothetical protein
LDFLRKKEMITFHGDKKVKAKYLARVRAHQASDELVHSIGFDGVRGCHIPSISTSQKLKPMLGVK